MEPLSTQRSALGTQHSLLMVPLSAGWSDLGAWDAVWQVGDQDANGNVTQGDTLTADTTNSPPPLAGEGWG